MPNGSFVPVTLSTHLLPLIEQQGRTITRLTTGRRARGTGLDLLMDSRNSDCPSLVTSCLSVCVCGYVFVFRLGFIFPVETRNPLRPQQRTENFLASVRCCAHSQPGSGSSNNGNCKIKHAMQTGTALGSPCGPWCVLVLLSQASCAWIVPAHCVPSASEDCSFTLSLVAPLPFPPRLEHCISHLGCDDALDVD